MKRVAILLIASALLVPFGSGQSHADDPLWVKQVIRQQHHKERLQRRRDQARVYSYVRREEDDYRDRCRDRRRVVGDQGLSVALAQGQADKSWAADVRFHLGERYMDIANAEDIKYECSRSSVGETLGQTFHRCQISANPCKAPKMEANKR